MPEPHRPVADLDVTFVPQVLYAPEWQREPDMELSLGGLIEGNIIWVHLLFAGALEAVLAYAMKQA